MSAEEYVDSDVDEFLEHMGVKGMKWGKRSAAPGPAGGAEAMFKRFDKEQADVANMQVGRAPKAAKVKAPKVTSKEIQAARYRNELRFKKFQESQGDFYVARGAKAKTKAEATMRKYEKMTFDNEDTATANRMTAGEKATVAIGAAMFVAYATIAIAGSATKYR